MVSPRQHVLDIKIEIPSLSEGRVELGCSVTKLGAEAKLCRSNLMLGKRIRRGTVHWGEERPKQEAEVGPDYSDLTEKILLKCLVSVLKWYLLCFGDAGRPYYSFVGSILSCHWV